MYTPSESQRAALDAVLARAQIDAAFRAQLLSDPRRAIADAFDMRVPDDFRIRFIERDADVDALIVLPDLRRARTDELSDTDLEQVTGGAHAHNAHLAWKGTVPPKEPHGTAN